jgi:putative ABC transport system permease protein
MAMSDWGIVMRSMRSRSFSTVMTVITVGVAAALMTLLISMRSAGENAFQRGTGNVQILVSKEPGPLSSVLNSMFYAEAPGNPISMEQYDELVDSYPFAWAIPTQLGDSYRSSSVMATTTQFFEDFEPATGEPWELEIGEYFDEPMEVVFGADAAKEHTIELGDKVSLDHGSPGTAGSHVHDEFLLTVVGILKPTATAHDRAVFTSLESSWILHAHDRRETVFGHTVQTDINDITGDDRKITGIYASIGSRKAALVQVLSALRLDPNWTVANPADTVGSLFAIVSNIDELLLAMAVAVMISSAVSILVALYNSMEQRRRQIAILRVLGATKFRVFNLVLTESAAIGLIGGVLGIALALVGGIAVSTILQARVGIVIHPSLPIDGYLMILLSTIALSSIAGVIPAMLAYRTSVIKSLRPIG